MSDDSDMADPGGYPEDSMAADCEQLARAAENLKRAFFDALRSALEPLVDYMSKVGRHGDS
jgi:hypothetical protein